MAIIIGSLASQNWHRQVRQRGLTGRDAFYYTFDKTVAAGREFGFSPMGIDFGVGSIAWASPRELDELRGRIRDNGLYPMVGFGQVAVHHDAEVRQANLAQIRRDLELVATFGCKVSNFSCARNGRITREGQIVYAIETLREVGKMAADHGLLICQEDFDWWRSDELIRISRETGLDNVGIQSDTGNWLILGEDPVAATRACLPYTFHTHVRDYVLERGTYNGVAVGAGLVDFGQVLPLLARASRPSDVVFSMEVDTDDRDEDQCARDSYAYLKRWCLANGHGHHIRG